MDREMKNIVVKMANWWHQCFDAFASVQVRRVVAHRLVDWKQVHTGNRVVAHSEMQMTYLHASHARVHIVQALRGHISSACEGARMGSGMLFFLVIWYFILSTICSQDMFWMTSYFSIGESNSVAIISLHSYIWMHDMLVTGAWSGIFLMNAPRAKVSTDDDVKSTQLIRVWCICVPFMCFSGGFIEEIDPSVAQRFLVRICSKFSFFIITLFFI